VLEAAPSSAATCTEQLAVVNDALGSCEGNVTDAFCSTQSGFENGWEVAAAGCAEYATAISIGSGGVGTEVQCFGSLLIVYGALMVWTAPCRAHE
jgi:hypothetical protein